MGYADQPPHKVPVVLYVYLGEQATAAAVWWCKRWLSLNRESATDRKSAGAHRLRPTTDAHSHCHDPYRPGCDEQSLHAAIFSDIEMRMVSWQ